MAAARKFTRTIPKHPTDQDESLRAVLDDISFRGPKGRALVDYAIETASVKLTYQKYPPPEDAD